MLFSDLKSHSHAHRRSCFRAPSLTPSPMWVRSLCSDDSKGHRSVEKITTGPISSSAESVASRLLPGGSSTEKSDWQKSPLRGLLDKCSRSRAYSLGQAPSP